MDHEESDSFHPAGISRSWNSKRSPATKCWLTDFFEGSSGTTWREVGWLAGRTGR